MKHIITSGCSYTSHKKINNNIAWPYHILDNINEKYQPVKLHNMAISGIGNFVISMNCINKIQTLLNDNVNPKEIYVFLQWSGLFRPTVYNENYNDRIIPFNEIEAKSEIKEIHEKNSFGFIDSAAKKTKSFWMNYFDNYYTTPAAFIDYLNIILKTQWFLQSKNIKYKMFNAWDVFTSKDGKSKKYIKDILLSDTQFDNKKYNNIENKLLTDMYPWSKIFWKMLDLDNYLFFTNNHVKFGGLTQWVQNNLRTKDWYVSSSDKHPSTKAHEKFTKDVIIPILTKVWGSDNETIN